MSGRRSERQAEAVPLAASPQGSRIAWQQARWQLERLAPVLLPRPIDWARLGLKGLGFSQYAELAHIGYQRGDFARSRFDGIMSLIHRNALLAGDRAGADRAMTVWGLVKWRDRRAQQRAAASRERPTRQRVTTQLLLAEVKRLRQQKVPRRDWVGRIRRTIEKQGITISGEALRKRLTRYGI